MEYSLPRPRNVHQQHGKFNTNSPYGFNLIPRLKTQVKRSRKLFKEIEVGRQTDLQEDASETQFAKQKQKTNEYSHAPLVVKSEKNAKKDLTSTYVGWPNDEKLAATCT